MWQFFSVAIARHVFQAPNEQSRLFAEATEWGGLCFAAYNVVCFLIAFTLPSLANRWGRKAVHTIALICGGIGLNSVFFISSKWLLFASMAGVGVAWASILSMPYVMLSTAVPPARMGVYMGVFNLFIVIPQIVQSLIMPNIFNNVLRGDPRNAVVLGGFSLLIAAATVVIVRDTHENRV